MAKKFYGFLVLLFLAPSLTACRAQGWEAVVSTFVEEYRALRLEPLHLAYTDNLNGIQDAQSLERQAQVFANLRNGLEQITHGQLTPDQELEYDLLAYQLALHEERLVLEKRWQRNPMARIPDTGLIHVTNGKQWYAHFLKRWIDSSVTPDALFEFGLSEIKEVRSQIRELQTGSGMDSLAFERHILDDRFFYSDAQTVKEAFEAFSTKLAKTLPSHFPNLNSIPKVKIARATDTRLSQVPAYYRDNTFYFNFFDTPFNKRQIAFLYLHEALPGHHYEISHRRLVPRSQVLQLFHTPGYSEGWAAYVEEIGNDIGGYATPYDELGKWEWDLIRSVRVPLDVGLNYYGWSDGRAMAFWQGHIQGKDAIAEREIARIKRWPCQVISYKYGANKILEWKARYERDPNFKLKDFHSKVLRYGPLPFSVLERRMGDHVSRM